MSSAVMKDGENYLKIDEVHAVLDAARSCSARDYLLIKTMWITGVRVSELLNIRPRDLESDTIFIRKAKGGKQRYVHAKMNTNLITELRRYADQHEIAQDAPIFSLGRQWVHALVKRYGAVIGRDTLHPHSLRHSFAVHSVRNGVDLRRLQLALGHASLNTTASYLMFCDADLREAYENVPF